MIRLGNTHDWIDGSQPINRKSPFAKGLVSAYIATPRGPSGFNSGIWRDFGANKSNGTLTNGPTWSGLAKPGGFGSLYVTETSARHVVIPSTGLPNATADVTVTAWVYPTTFSNWGMFVGQSNNLNHFLVRYGMYSNGNTSGLYGNVAGSFTLHSSALTLNAWNFIAISNNATEFLFAINDTIDTAAAKSAPTSDSIDWKIGNWGTDTFPPTAYVDDVRIYSVGHNANTLRAIKAESLLGYPTLLNRISRPMAYPASAAAAGQFWVVGGGNGGASSVIGA